MAAAARVAKAGARGGGVIKNHYILIIAATLSNTAMSDPVERTRTFERGQILIVAVEVIDPPTIRVRTETELRCFENNKRTPGCDRRFPEANNKVDVGYLVPPCLGITGSPSLNNAGCLGETMSDGSIVLNIQPSIEAAARSQRVVSLGLIQPIGVHTQKSEMENFVKISAYSTDGIINKAEVVHSSGSFSFDISEFESIAKINDVNSTKLKEHKSILESELTVIRDSCRKGTPYSNELDIKLKRLEEKPELANDKRIVDCRKVILESELTVINNSCRKGTPHSNELEIKLKRLEEKPELANDKRIVYCRKVIDEKKKELELRAAKEEEKRKINRHIELFNSCIDDPLDEFFMKICTGYGNGSPRATSCIDNMKLLTDKTTRFSKTQKIARDRLWTDIAAAIDAGAQESALTDSMIRRRTDFDASQKCMMIISLNKRSYSAYYKRLAEQDKAPLFKFEQKAQEKAACRHSNAHGSTEYIIRDEFSECLSKNGREIQQLSDESDMWKTYVRERVVEKFSRGQDRCIKECKDEAQACGFSSSMAQQICGGE